MRSRLSAAIRNCAANLKAVVLRTARRAALVALGSLAIAGTAAANSVTDATTGAVRTWTVPAGVTEIRVTAEGGSGGRSSGGLAGGSGATASGVFMVTPGQLVTYIVGQQGGTGTTFDGGGGGSTGVFVNGTLQIVAGGGAGYDNTQGAAGAQGGRATNNGQNGVGSSGCLAVPGGTAGNGGGGGNQYNDPCGTVVPDKDGGAGGGGINSAGQNAAGGAGGGGQGNALTPAVAPGGVTITDTLGTGANGGSGFSGGGASEPREAGGGGGYSGGGGGNSGGRPGGGGSWVRPGTSGATLTQGAVSTNNGNGSVVIEWSTLTLAKTVINDDVGTAPPSAFTLRVSSTFGDQTNATARATGNVINITSNRSSNTYTVSEDAFPGYTLTSNSCSSLVHALANIGTDYTCTLVNNDNPVSINALPETFAPILGTTGGTTPTVLGSDTLNGLPISNPALVAVTVTVATGGLTLNASNQIVVPAGLAPGPYTLTYQVCEIAVPGNCDTQTETVTVLGIDAVAETFPAVPSATGGTTTSILASDTLNGAAIANPALVAVTVTGATGGLTMNASNQIVVPAGLAAGPYTLTYQICEVANPTNCDTVTETVNVVAIDAVAETFSQVSSVTGGTTTSILASDTLNGLPITNPALVAITLTGSTGGLTLNGSNQIVVPAGLAAGPYTLTYQICEVANPTNCDTVTETVTVGLIDAVAETFPAISSATGGTTTSILASDTLNGVPITNPALVAITVDGFDRWADPERIEPDRRACGPRRRPLHADLPDMRGRQPDELRHGHGKRHRGHHRRGGRDVPGDQLRDRRHHHLNPRVGHPERRADRQSRACGHHRHRIDRRADAERLEPDRRACGPRRRTLHVDLPDL